jgi:hypothetical protein
MKLTMLFFTALLPIGANADNYATCILEKMPGAKNDAVVFAAKNLCRDEYPDGMSAVKQGSGRGFFSFDNGAECTLKKAATTLSRPGAMAIRAACRRLYDEPNPFAEFESGPK